MDISRNFIFKEKDSVEDKKADLIEKFNSFDLGERGGGEQLIIDYKAISSTEYDVMALGNGPRLKEEDINDDIKIRFFRLTFAEGTKFNVAEYITPESICRVAKLFV